MAWYVFHSDFNMDTYRTKVNLIIIIDGPIIINISVKFELIYS
jgi:hypothetical protein